MTQSSPDWRGMRSFRFWNNWLIAVSLFVTFFGLVMATLNGTFIFEPLNRNIDPAFWGDGEVPAAAESFQRWVYGAWGATVAGWGVFLVYLSLNPFRRRERWSWMCIAVGVTLWFIIDSAYSIYYGVLFNAMAVNLPLYLAVLVPLLRTQRFFNR